MTRRSNGEPQPRVSSAATEPAGLQSFVDGVDDRLNGRLGVCVTDIETDRETEPLLARRRREAFGSASVVKLLVLYALYEAYDDRLEELSEPRPIAPENRVDGSGLLGLFDGSTQTIEELATAMIAVSDNAATNELIDLLGVERIEASADSLGLEETRLRRKMMRTRPIDGSAGSGQEARPDSSRADQRYLNTVSPADCVQLLRDVATRGRLSTAAYDRLRAPLEAQNDVSMAARYLPERVEPAHKTGYLPSVAADAGLLTVDGRTVAYAYCCDGLESWGPGTDAIAAVSEAVYRFLDQPDDCGSR